MENGKLIYISKLYNYFLQNIFVNLKKKVAKKNNGIIIFFQIIQTLLNKSQ